MVEFDASLLQAGANTVTFRHTGNGLNNVMYDCIRLEIKDKSDINSGDSRPGRQAGAEDHARQGDCSLPEDVRDRSMR